MELPSPGGDVGAVVAAPQDPADFLFDPTQVRTVELTASTEDLAKIDAAPADEVYIPGTITVDGQSRSQVGIRYKGSVGAFLLPCTDADYPGKRPGAKTGKCSMKVAFDEYDDDARFFGLRKLNLHSMGRDQSLLREHLGYALYRRMGVAAPRTAYVRLVINGQLEGLFLLVEQIDGRFTRSRFSEGGEGNLYKEIWPLYDDPALYRTALESNKGSDTVVDKMLAFKRSIDDSPMESTQWIDRDYMMRYLAVDRVILNDDGAMHWYCIRGQGNNSGPYGNHNYYWYEAATAGRFWLIPWDLDGSFGNEPRVHIEPEWSAETDCMCRVAVGLPQRGASCDPLTGELASWRAEYEAMVDQFLSGPFAQDLISDEIDEVSARILPFVTEATGVDGAPDVIAWRYAVKDLRALIDRVRDNRGYPYDLTPP